MVMWIYHVLETNSYPHVDSASVLAHGGYAARPYFSSQQFRPEQEDRPNIGSPAFLAGDATVAYLHACLYAPVATVGVQVHGDVTEQRTIPRGS
jgi:hypothetical protein